MKKSRLLGKAKSHLDSDETVLGFAEGICKSKWMGSKTERKRKGLFLATETRLVFYGKRIFGYHLESFPYRKISSFETGKGLMGTFITLFAKGNKVSMRWIAKGDAQALASLVRERME